MHILFIYNLLPVSPKKQYRKVHDKSKAFGWIYLTCFMYGGILKRKKKEEEGDRNVRRDKKK